MILLLSLLACAPPPAEVHTGGAEPDPPEESAPPAWDTGAPLEPVPGSGTREEDSAEPQGEDSGCSELYDPEVVQDFEIEIAEEDWAALERDYARGEKSWHPVVFRWGDEQVDDAMIRLKGNPSFSWFTEKMQFVIGFNQLNPDGRFHGVRKLALDASWYEPTLLRDRLAWSILRRQGDLPAACASSATLTVNGALYGLYTNIEYLDHEWLERVFGDADASGTLWKYGTEAVSNEEAASGAVDRLWSTTDVDTLEGLGDLAEWQLAWAAEIALGDDDGYWCCAHNFYLYEHPGRGVLWVPWDLDDDFDVQPYDTDPVTGYTDSLFRQAHFMALLRDPSWGPAMVDAVEIMAEALDPAVTLDELDRWAEQIGPSLEADPSRSIGLEEHEGAVERMRAWIPARQAFLRSWVACARGEETDADGDGYAVCEDPDDGDARVNPGASETCDGRDEDADGVVDDDPSCDDCARHDLEDAHYLFCRFPRTQAEAEANCAARGGSLDGYATTGEYYLLFFYTWPVFESWWIGGASGGGRCATWESGSWTTGAAPCEEEHPSVCRLE